MCVSVLALLPLALARSYSLGALFPKSALPASSSLSPAPSKLPPLQQLKKGNLHFVSLLEKERGHRRGVARHRPVPRQEDHRQRLQPPQGHGEEERQPNPLVRDPGVQRVDDRVREAGEYGEAW